ncbi:hypothetical protein GT755_30940 [Herbidospora sp. NEAU-GS84]|uniref:Transglutaminase-like domain-containing protein n=1 Tax=Herbidospora solisilvae TaxID=2696284 RepID=A0A7C9NIG2_9ACTN|nr:transglutaminase domain-containing protein [Herbidospora solisilvae]NAS26075.1 hypothetical protein [Herbidospora solisilvae]
MPPLRRTIIAVVCAAGAGAQSLVYLRVFTDLQVLVPLMVAALGGAAAGLVTRRSGRLVALASACAGPFVLTGAPVAQLAEGLWLGWIRLLTIGLPAPVSGDLVATPILITATAAFAATITALRGGSGRALVVLATAFGVGLLLSASGPGEGVPLMGAAVVVLVVLLRVGPAPGRLRWAVWTVTVVTAGASGLVSAGGHDRFDPRTLVAPPPLDLGNLANPLARVRPQVCEEEPAGLFTLEIDGPVLARIRLVTLDHYDGITWTVGERFHVPGVRLGRGEGDPYRLRVTVTGLTGPFLPLAGQPERLSFTGAAPVLVEFADGTDTVVVDPPLRSGARYEVTVSHEAEVRPGDFLALPADTGPWLAKHAKEMTEGATTPWEQAVALEEKLKAERACADGAPAGHTLPALRRFLLDGAGGTVEQHAAAFALLARSLGLPSRVAVGYLLGEPVGGLHQVRNRDAHAWPEVYFEERGWVPFDAADGDLTPPRPTDPPPVSPPETHQPPPPPLPGGSQTGGRQVPWISVVLVATLLAVLALWVVVVTVTRLVRRLLRARGTPHRRVLGAWRESLDRLAEAGVVVRRSQTPLETIGGAPVTTPNPGRLADLVTRVQFSVGETTAVEAERAWILARRLAKDLRDVRPLPRRLLASLDPRLFWRSWR